MRGSPSQQARDNMFRIKDVLKNCPVFRDNYLFLEHIVVFSNPKDSITIGQEPEYGCKVIHFKKKADSNPADFIANKLIRFSDQKVAKIERCLRANIANYRIQQFAFKESCALHRLSKSLQTTNCQFFLFWSASRKFRIAVGSIILVSYDFKLFQKLCAAFALMITLIQTQTKMRASPKPFASHFRHLPFNKP